MANQITIDIGAAANDGTGDPLRTAFNYVNNNFSNVWNTGLPNSNVQFSDNRILTVNTNANLVLAPNGIGKVASNVDIVPNTANVFSLGGPARRWNTIYGQYLDLSHNATIGGNLVVTGNLTAGNISYTSNVFVGDLEGSVFDGASSIVLDVIDSAIYVDNYYYANGVPFSGGSGNYGNANVAAYLPTYTGNISAGNAAITNLTSSNLVNGRTGTFTGDQFSDGAMYVGSPAGTVLGSDVVIQITANSGSYSQTNFQNINSGVTASSDYILTADNGNNTTHYLDMGITSSGWDGSETNVLAGLVANNGYLYVQDGNLTVGVRNGNVSYGWNFDTTGNLTVPKDIIPTGNNTQNLGSATRQWNDLYLSNATIYMNSVPISLTAGNVLTVNGADVVTTAANGESSIGNLDILGTTVSIAAGAPETYINLSASVEGWAYVQVPTDATANISNVRVHNDAGNIEFGTGDYSTGATGYIWTLDTDGRMTIPGIIFSSNTIEINNQATSNTADIRLNSADDIFLQGRDKPDDLEAEGGDIFVYGGDGANAATSGHDTGGGGDIQIEGGIGGAGEATGTSGGGGGIVIIRGGDGGTSLDSNAGGGGDINLTAGSAPGAATTALGGLGGGVNIIAGTTTRINESGGSIELTTGGASGDGSGAAGYVSINIASSNVGPGGQWIFSGTGTTLNVPANAEIYGANFGNFTVGCAGNTIVTSSDYGANVQNWVFGYTGTTTFPDNTLATNDDFVIQVSDGIPTSTANINSQGGYNIGSYTGLSTTGGSGTGLTVNASTAGNGYIDTVTINAPGSGYTNGDTITIVGGDGLGCTFTIGVPTPAWSFATDGSLTVPGISTGSGTGEIQKITGSRRSIGITNDPDFAYAATFAGHSDFGSVAFTASTSLVQSVRVTFAIQTNGAAFNWEQFDVAATKLDSANAFVSVSGRVRSNSAIDYTDVSAYVNEGGAIEILLNPPDGQTAAYVNYDAVEFNLFLD